MRFLRSRSVLLLTINLVIVAALIYYLYINANQLIGLLQVSAIGIIFILLLSSTSPLINGYINAYLFQTLGANITLKNGFYLAGASTLANELPVSGGIFAKGYYLKRMHNLSYTKYFSASLAFFVCVVAVNGGIGLVILSYWIIFKNSVSSPFLWMGFSAMVSFLTVFLIPLEHKFIPTKLQVWISQFLEGWTVISRNPQLLLKLVVFQSGLMLAFAIRYWLAFRMISQEVTFSQSILFSSATVLTQLVSFAPGGLGVRELIVGSISSALGFSLEASVTAVGLDRLISTIATVTIGWRSLIILGKQMSRERNPQE